MKSKFLFRFSNSSATAHRFFRPLRTVHLTFGFIAALSPFAAEQASALTRTWIGGNVDWVDNSGTANWTGGDEPDFDDDAVFNTPNTVKLGGNHTAILSLALSGGISLNTNNFDLPIDGLLQLTGSGTDLTIGGSASTVDSDSVTINSSSTIILNGGALTMAASGAATGLIDNKTGGTLTGKGTITLNDAVAVPTTLMINNGVISATPAGIVEGMPPAGTLAINAASANARLDLDGTLGGAWVSVWENQLLDINVALTDAFSEDMILYHHSTIDVSTPWSIDAGAAIDIDNGAVGGTYPLAADTSFISGAAFTQSGGRITVRTTDGTLQFNAPFTMSGGNLVNNGLVVFNANATIGAGANFTMPGSTSSLTVNAGVEVNIDQPNFNADGSDTASNIITVGSGGILDLDLGVGADESINAALRLNGGEIDVTTASDTWSINRSVTMGANTGTSQINGEPVTFSGAAVTLGTNAILRINAASTLNSTASFAVASGATLGFPTAPVFNGASFTGDGIMRVEGSSQVADDTTIGVNTFDWDWNTLGQTHTINTGVTFTINSPVWMDAMDDAVTLQGSGSTLNVSGSTEWNMNGPLNSNPAAAGSATVGGTSRVIFGGAINANSGTTWITAPVTFGATAATTVAAGAMLNTTNSLRFLGGTFTGAGTLRVGNTSTVDANTTIAVNTFDWDGTGIGSPHSISDGVTFTINSPNFDDDGDMDDPLTIGGNGATLIFSGPASWEMKGTLTTNPAKTGLATIGGSSRMILTSASGILNANGDTTISAPVTLDTASTTNVAAAALLTLANSSTAFAGGSVAGAGTLRVGNSSSVTANTTIAVNTFDWDGTGIGSLHTIADGVTFTINSPNFDDDGDMDDPLTVRGSGGTLAVNGPVSWDMRNTLTTNPTAAGTTTLGGTSRMVLTSAAGVFNANGNTNVTAPITFDAGSTTTVAAGAFLMVDADAIYNGGTLTGLGEYWPPTGNRNTVVANSTISTTKFNFDRGSWTVQPGARLTVNVGDYDPDAATKSFDTALTLNSGIADVNTADAVFVMEGRLNLNNTTGVWPYWIGEPIQIGDDIGTLDAALMVAGTGVSGIYSPITFKSDAEVNIAAGATLWLFREATFEPVNGAVNASFTGAGTLITNDSVYYDEATTLNLSGGRVDLDGTASTGKTHYIYAPLAINTATFDSFGKFNSGGGSNILDVVNGWGETGKLTVNLDNPAAEWTLNKEGILVLKNEPAAAVATLLAGSDANLNGYVQITGDVRTDARVDIGSTIDIQTAGKPFRLSGGDLTDTNTLMNGTINGPGILGADTGSSLFGYGTINANIDFDGSSDLLADNGTLTVNGSLLDARYVGTNDSDGILDVVNAWNSNTVSGVRLNGGELKGGTLTNSGAGGISGSGLVSSRVINNTIINANHSGATLIVETAANNNDWDGSGAPETGQLQANAGTLEIRSLIMGGAFLFNGTVTAVNGGTVFASGFALAMEPGSALNLTPGTFKQSDGQITDLSGTVTVGTGTSSLLGAATGGFRFNATSVTTLNGNLQLDCPTTTIRSGATFGGAGRLINQFGRQLAPDHSATMNVLVENRGMLTPGATGIGRNDMLDYLQTTTGSLAVNLNGTSIGDFDRLIVNGNAQLAGALQLSLGGGYVPALNDTLTIVSATAGVTGTFAPPAQPAGMPAGLAFEVIYNPTNVQLKVVSSTPFDTWINSFGITNPADRTKGANPDGDSLNNLGEFATDGNPVSGVNSGKIVGKIAPVGGVNAFTLTLPVRYGAILDPADPAGGELGLKQTTDGLFYKIQASDELGAWTLTVDEVTGSDALKIRLGLPPLNSGWIYRTFRSPGPVAGDPREFMRVKITSD